MEVKKRKRKKASPIVDKSIARVPNEIREAIEKEAEADSAAAAALIPPDITGPGGAPTKYIPEFDDMVIKHMKKGLSFETFAAVIKVSRAVLHEWVKHNASFNEAVEQGHIESLKFWESLGLSYMNNNRTKMIDVEEETIAPDGTRTIKRYQKQVSNPETLNTTIYRLNMTNRFGWRSDKGVTINNNQNTQVNLHAQIMQLIREKKKQDAGG